MCYPLTRESLTNTPFVLHQNTCPSWRTARRDTRKGEVQPFEIFEHPATARIQGDFGVLAAEHRFQATDLDSALLATPKDHPFLLLQHYSLWIWGPQGSGYEAQHSLDT